MSLPSNWASASVGEIFRVVGGGTPSTVRTDYWSGTVPWISSADISDNHELTARRHITQEAIRDSATNLVPAESVIVVTRVGLGKVAIATTPVCFSQDSQALLFSPQFFNPRYVLLYMSTAVKVFKHISRGTTINGVTKRQLAELQFLLPPRKEQDRIVAEIEKQFTRLDDAVAALKRVQANLKRYRASVLKAACEGRLVPTEAELARKERRAYEPASELLKRILAERRAKWEADQLQKMIATGKAPKDDAWKKNYKDPEPPDTTDIRVIPEGWALASMDQLTTNITSGSRDWSPFYGRGSGVFIMAQNVRPANFDLSFKQAVDPPENDASRGRSAIAKNDLLVTIVGANTGDICRVPDDLAEHYVCQSVALMRPVVSNMARFLERYMCSEENGHRQYRRYIYGAGRPHLSFDQLRMTAVLVPPLDEMRRILAETEAKTSVLDSMSSIIEAQLKHAAVLRQTILRTAFSGKLVPQDPNDEPASALLERIRHERARAQQQNGKTPKATNGASPANAQRRRRVNKLAQRVSAGKG